MVANYTLCNLIYHKDDWDEARKFLSSGPTDGSEDDFIANILYRDVFGRTTLMWAITYEATTDIITSLIDKGGKDLVMMKDCGGQTALHMACDYGASVEVVKLLLNVGGDELIVIKNDDGDTALDIANEYASDEVNQIINDGITTFDFNKIIKSNKPNLPQLKSFVKEHGIKGLFTVLIDKGSLPIKSIAESNPSIDVIYYILQKGVVKMGETEEEYRGKYPTIRSDWNDLFEKAVIPLVKTGRKDLVMQQDDENNTVLHVAIVEASSCKIIEQLLHVGGKDLVMQQDRSGNTSLHVAIVEASSNEIIEQLLHVGGKDLAMQQDSSGNTALHVAIKTGVSCKIIEQLLHVGGKDLVMQQDSSGNTALHVAIKTGVSEIVKGYRNFGKERDLSERILNLVHVGGRELALVQNRECKNAYEIACVVGAVKAKISYNELEILQNLVKDGHLLLGRYRIADTHAIYKSATSVVMKGECIFRKCDVAVKFITKHEHYIKEHAYRERVVQRQTDKSKRLLIVPIRALFDGTKDFDQQPHEASKMDEESRRLMDVFDGKKTKVKLCHCKYAIVMNLAGRNLDTIYREEGLRNNNTRRGWLLDILKTMQILNEACLCHGDLKMRNCVRMNGRMYIIDLDGASEIPKRRDDASMDKSNAAYYVGAKFSSGILAPEMIHRFRGEKGFDVKAYGSYLSYFAELQSEDPEHWEKVQPMIHDDCAYAVKTFLTTKRGTKRSINGEEAYTPVIVKDIDKLPYDLVQASEAIDLWSLGVMLYKFETDEDIFNIDQRNDDLKRFEDMEKLACWDGDKMNETLLEVTDVQARDLLGKLLSKDPVKRGSIAEVLKHPYITGVEIMSKAIVNHPVNEMQCSANVTVVATSVEEVPIWM